MSNIKRLERSRTDRIISGVCGGVARQFNLDTVIVRVLFVVIAIINPGIAAIAYVAAIFLIPEESEMGAANTEHPGWRYDPWTGESIAKPSVPSGNEHTPSNPPVLVTPVDVPAISNTDGDTAKSAEK